MRCTILLICCLFSVPVFSQDEWKIQFNPVALIDFTLPAIQFGADYQVSERFSVFNELGIKYRRVFYEKFVDSALGPSNGLRFKTELRYHLRSPESRWKKRVRPFTIRQTYIGLSLFYLRDRHNNEAFYYFSKDSSDERIDSYNARKNVFGAHFVTGKEYYFGEHFGLDFYVGFGARLRSVKTTHQEFDPNRDILVSPRHPNIQYNVSQTDLERKKSGAGSVAFGLRFFYRL